MPETKYYPTDAEIFLLMQQISISRESAIQLLIDTKTTNQMTETKYTPEEVTTYTEMNKSIIGLLRMKSDCPISIYAAKRIMELEHQVTKLSENNPAKVLPLSKEDQRKLSKEYFQANPSDEYNFTNTDAAYHKGIEIGIWAFDKEIKEGHIK